MGRGMRAIKIGCSAVMRPSLPAPPNHSRTRRFINLAVAALALTVLAGCGGNEQEGSPVSDASPTTRTQDGFAGTVRIGAALSETGKFAVEGRDSRQGYDTWVRWVN